MYMYMYQVAADVRCTTTATADYDGLAKRVYREHTDTVALSEKMTPVISGITCTSYLFLLVLMPLCIAVGRGRRGRRDGDEWFGMANWYNFICHEYVAAGAATSIAALLVWQLVGPAKVTFACQKVVSAVNDLRVNAGDDGTVTLVTSEQGHRIEILMRYINELNDAHGLGLLVQRKRIIFTLVMGLMIQTVSLMPLVMGLLYQGWWALMCEPFATCSGDYGDNCEDYY